MRKCNTFNGVQFKEHMPNRITHMTTWNDVRFGWSNNHAGTKCLIYHVHAVLLTNASQLVQFFSRPLVQDFDTPVHAWTIFLLMQWNSKSSVAVKTAIDRLCWFWYYLLNYKSNKITDFQGKFKKVKFITLTQTLSTNVMSRKTIVIFLTWYRNCNQIFGGVDAIPNSIKFCKF